MSTSKINKYNWEITGDEGAWPEVSFRKKKKLTQKCLKLKNKNNKKNSTLMKNSYPHKNNLQGLSQKLLR